jgi:hypothetical protein
MEGFVLIANGFAHRPHSAMEDFVRIGVLQTAPHLRDKVEDVKQTARIFYLLS